MLLGSGPWVGSGMLAGGQGARMSVMGEGGVEAVGALVELVEAACSLGGKKGMVEVKTCATKPQN